jgi:predicted Zn-dependent peptidase
MKKLFALGFVAGLQLWVASNAQATIYLDKELDPLPLFSLQVMLPVGALSSDPVEAAAVAIYSEITEDGTERLNKQEYVDALSSFGANISFGVGRDTASWSVSFPIIQGKDYAPLVELAKENWTRPRLTQEAFEKARVKLDAALKSTLDNDMALAAVVGRRWLGIKDFNLFPLLQEGLAKVTLDDVKKIAESKFLSLEDVWAGYVGPQGYEYQAEMFLKSVFEKQGGIKRGKYRKSLVKRPPLSAQYKAKKEAIIVEKSGRSQVVFFVIGVYPEFPSKFEDELAYHFGGHILGFSGLGSYFGDEIRNKRGLAYTVSPLQKFFLGKPSVGFLTNPIREKQVEAMELISDLLKSAYEESDVFRVLPEEVWKRQWQSFRYGHILDNSSVAARLSLRRSVVEGELSPKLQESNPASWDVSREELSRYFRDSWAEASRLIVVVGESKELKPLLSKYFPDYSVTVMGLQQSNSQASYLQVEKYK